MIPPLGASAVYTRSVGPRPSGKSSLSPTRHTAPILAVLLFAGAASGQVVDPGDILVASTTATEGQIEKVDPLTGETEVVVAYGGVGTRIQDIAVAGDGTIYAAGARSIVSLDPLSGQVTSVASGRSR